MPDLVQQTEITAFRGKPWKTHIPKKNQGENKKIKHTDIINQTYMVLSQHVAEHPYLESHKTS